MEQKTMSTIKDFFSKCNQIYEKLQIWSHLQKKSLMENFIFWAVFIKKRPNTSGFLWILQNFQEHPF